MALSPRRKRLLLVLGGGLGLLVVLVLAGWYAGLLSLQARNKGCFIRAGEPNPCDVPSPSPSFSPVPSPAPSRAPSPSPSSSPRPSSSPTATPSPTVFPAPSPSLVPAPSPFAPIPSTPPLSPSNSVIVVADPARTPQLPVPVTVPTGPNAFSLGGLVLVSASFATVVTWLVSRRLRRKEAVRHGR